jgi:phthalate 4,5-dioxygenase
MGELMRQYWIPALLSSELPAADSDPVRVLLLSEKLIAFRDSNGKVGLLDHACPHRGASLFFGRNEECGLRCAYHGWKSDANGTCVDMPNEPAESDFKHKVKARSYPTEERGGVVWAYLGPRSTPSPLPGVEGNMVEGAPLFGGRYGDWRHLWRVPRGGAGYEFWRIANFLLPFYTMNPQGLLGAGPQRWQARVPMDDTHMISFGFAAPRRQSGASRPAGGQSRQLLPNTTDWYGLFRQVSNLDNDFLIDRDLQRSNTGPNGFTGIEGVGRQDQAVTTSMGAIYDRSKEHLASSDSMIIRVRRRLLTAVRAYAETGMTPPGVDEPELYGMRSGSVILPAGVDWFEATRELRKAFVEHPDPGPQRAGWRSLGLAACRSVRSSRLSRAGSASALPSSPGAGGRSVTTLVISLCSHARHALCSLMRA